MTGPDDDLATFEARLAALSELFERQQDLTAQITENMGRLIATMGRLIATAESQGETIGHLLDAVAALRGDDPPPPFDPHHRFGRWDPTEN